MGMERSNLYLRDAGVLLDRDGSNFLKRLDRCVSLAKENRLAIQITLDREFFLKGHERLEKQLIDGLVRFDRVLIHLHSNQLNRFGRNYFTDKSLTIIKRLFEQCNNIEGLCVHPDLVDDFSALERFIVNGKYMGIEVLDENVTFGNHFSEIREILEEYEFLDLVLDTAHVQEMARKGEPDLDSYFDVFGDRVKEVHLSETGNYYENDFMSEDFTTSHSLLCADHGATEILPNLRRSFPVNYVIEGIVPYGRYGEDLLKKEVEMLRRELVHSEK
ncbi:MAG: hypothetical protein ABID54_03595 [Pseudomonadota bacterium]